MGDRLGRGRKLIESGKCPTCLQPSTGAGEKIVAQAERQLLEAQDQEEKRKRDRDLVKDRIDAARKKLTAYNTRRDDLNAQIKRARERLGDLEKAAADEAERNAGREAKIRRKSLQLGLQKRYRRAAIAARQEMSVGVEMLEYVKKAFQRSGIPLYLSVSLCPLLNKAAEEYSEIFTDGNLKVSFRVEDGEFAVDVVNPVGSSTVEGQSEGESAMAGLIAAFALREAAPKTNMLILDEPGTKLDPEGCKQFARGILRLKDHFETILLVTHSPYISSLLSGETVYTVKKRNGRSRLFLSSSRESVRNEQG
jgi:DNA repair exonuclease SbcCD ATPase subunit